LQVALKALGMWIVQSYDVFLVVLLVVIVVVVIARLCK
jgi:hypothetical protein